MIDYDKLKLTHQLALLYLKQRQTIDAVTVTCRFKVWDNLPDFTFDYFGSGAYEEIGPVSLDTLFAELKELTNSKKLLNIQDLD